MSAKNTAIRRQDEINEKLTYLTKCNEWISAQVSGDIKTLAALTGKSLVTISKAVNHGEGSLKLLRAIASYYEKRAEVIE